MFLSLSLSLCSTLGRKSEEQRRRRLLFAARLLKRLYRAWQRGPACPSLIALFILCAVQGVSNALGLCVGRETTHHILSSVPSWGMGGVEDQGGGGGGGTTEVMAVEGGAKSKLREGHGSSKLPCSKAY